MKVSVQTAESNLANLVDAALAGEEVLIAKGRNAVVKMVPVHRQDFVVGMLAGQLGTPPDFLEPMSDDDLAGWEGTA